MCCGVESFTEDSAYFWAKTTPDGQPGISVRDHCLNAGCVGEALRDALPPALKKLLPPGAVTLVALHDVGKISPGFLVKCPVWLAQLNLGAVAAKENWANHQSNHALVSQWTLQRLFRSSKLHGWSAVVGAHHGRPNERTLGLFKVRAVGGELWDQARLRLVDELKAEFGPLPEDPPESEAVLWYVAGLITVADWIGSDERHFSPKGGESQQARANASDALRELGWEPARFQTGHAFTTLFPACTPPHPLQTAALDQVREPGLYVMEAQMGAGKTEAALAAAYQLIAGGHASGLYFALPTQVTSNRIHRRVSDFLGRAEVAPDPRHLRLAHSNSWLLDKTGPPQFHPAAPTTEAAADASAGRSWFASSKRALLAPYGVGTIDQALLGIVAAKHFFVRQLGLAGKVVILDELHTYDLYTGTLVDVLIRRLLELKCTVIVLSATLTVARRRKLLALAGQPPAELSDSYPLLTACTPGKPSREISFPAELSRAVRVNMSVQAPAPVAEDLMERATAGECVLWVRNTVREAQETFRLLQAHRCEDGPPVALLHSRFPQFRREELENAWLDRLDKDGASRPRGCVLVATQVVEQSVDIDADHLVTDLAPTDMLLQRMGRLWRHARPQRPCAAPELHILLPEPLAALDVRTAPARQLKAALGPTGRVYAPYVLLRTLAQWQARTGLALPADIRPLLEATYAEWSDEPPAWRELRAELEGVKDKLLRLALNNTNVWNQPALPDEEGVQTRYNSRPTAQLLLATSVETLTKGYARVALLNGQTIEAADRDWSFPAAKAIHWNLVRVPRYAVAGALPATPAWLRLHVSGECALGLVRDGQIYWPGADAPSGLTWHPDEGVFIPQHALNVKSPDPQDDYESYD
jgi:CRISPR-associated endonuclease/helicase Cas3